VLLQQSVEVELLEIHTFDQKSALLFTTGRELCFIGSLNRRQSLLPNVCMV